MIIWREFWDVLDVLLLLDVVVKGWQMRNHDYYLLLFNSTNSNVTIRRFAGETMIRWISPRAVTLVKTTPKLQRELPFKIIIYIYLHVINIYIYIHISLFSADNDFGLKPHYGNNPNKKGPCSCQTWCRHLGVGTIAAKWSTFFTQPGRNQGTWGWPKKLRYVGGKKIWVWEVGGEMRSHIWHPRGWFFFQKVLVFFLVSKGPDGSLDSLIVDSWLWPVMG